MRTLRRVLVAAALAEAWREPCRFVWQGQEFVSHEKLEDYILGDGGNERGDRTELYDASVRPESSVDYNIFGRPSYITVNFEVQEFKLFEADSSWVVSGEVIMLWGDPRLVYNYTDACLSEPFVPEWRLSRTHHDKIWKPSIFFKNQLAAPESDLDTMSIVVSSPPGVGSGIVVMRYQTVVRLRCLMKFHRMPFDRQQCSINIQSLTSDIRELRYDPASTIFINQEDTSRPLTSTTWSIVKASSNIKAVDVTFTSKEVSTFSRLELGITFRRRHVYHVVNTFIPAFLFFLISYCGFWIDRKSAPARVAVCVLPVLITHNFVNHVASTLSPLPYFTVLNTYLTCLYLFGVSACIEYAAVQYHLSREAVAVATLPKLAALRHNLETMFTSDEIAAAEAEADDDDDGDAADDDAAAADADAGADDAARRRHKYDSLATAARESFVAHGKPGLAKLMTTMSNPVADKALKSLQECYKRADRDGDGRVDCREFAFALQQYGIYETPGNVRLALSNYRHHAGANDEDKFISSQEFGVFLLRYEEYRVADLFPADEKLTHFWFKPTSLRLDIAFRSLYIPVSVVVTFICCICAYRGDDEWV